MSDATHDESHEGPIKTPTQLIWTVVDPLSTSSAIERMLLQPLPVRFERLHHNPRSRLVAFLKLGAQPI